jgi:hypothetical protein
VLAQLALVAAAAATAWLTPLEVKHGLLEGPRWIRRLARSARKRTPRLAVRLREWLARRLSRAPFGPGYVWVDPQGNRFLHSGHLAAAGMFFATLAVYAGLGIWNAPGTARTFLALPALGALLLVLLMAAWILPALSFLLDRFRAPVILVLLLVSFTLFLVFGSDHVFRLVAAGPGPEAPELPATAGADLDVVDVGWLDDPAAPRPLVVVSAEGGGITAAAWTATALAGLAAGEAGGELLSSLRLVSGVSGGAVGAMFFVDRLPRAPLSEMGRQPAAWAEEVGRVAAESSLDPVGWAMAYPDLLRLLFSYPFATHWPHLDRSYALEESWRRRLSTPDRPPTLAGWRRAARVGTKPMVMMSATAVETGDRFVLSTLATDPPDGAARAASFWGTFPGWDLAVPTAARLSSTFPFVGLAARAAAPKRLSRFTRRSLPPPTSSTAATPTTRAWWPPSSSSTAPSPAAAAPPALHGAADHPPPPPPLRPHGARARRGGGGQRLAHRRGLAAPDPRQRARRLAGGAQRARAAALRGAVGGARRDRRCRRLAARGAWAVVVEADGGGALADPRRVGPARGDERGIGAAARDTAGERLHRSRQRET